VARTETGETASAAGHRGKSRIDPDEGVLMGLGWLTFVE
jgi:hypothetical protein